MSEAARIYFELRKVFNFVPAIKLWAQAKESAGLTARLKAQHRVESDLNWALGQILK